MKHFLLIFILFVVTILLTGCRDNFYVEIECKNCLDKSGYVDGRSTDGQGVFAIYMISDGNVVDARYFTENGNETSDLFAAFGNEHFLPEYLLDEGEARNSFNRSKRLYPLRNLPGDDYLDVETSKALVPSQMPSAEDNNYDVTRNIAKNTSAFRFTIPFGSKIYDDGDEVFQTAFGNNYVSIDNPIDKVIVVTPLGGIFASQCVPYRNFYQSINPVSRFKDVICNNFSHTYLYDPIYYISSSATDQLYGLAAEAFFLAYLYNPGSFVPFIKTTNYRVSNIDQLNAFPPYNLRSYTYFDGSEKLQELTGSDDFKNIVIKSDIPFTAYAIDELTSPNIATPLQCLVQEGKISNLAVNDEQTLLTLNTSVKISPYIVLNEFKRNSSLSRIEEVQILSHVSNANGDPYYASFEGINLFELCTNNNCDPMTIKPYSYSENGFYLHDLYSDESITIEDNCQSNSISDIALYGKYSNNTVNRVGETVRIQVDFTFPTKVSPSGRNNFSDHSITFSIGEQVVTAFGDKIITDGLSTEQIENNYISGMVFAFSVTDDMYSEEGIRFNHSRDELYFDKRYVSFNLRQFERAIPMHDSLTIASNNVSIMPEVNAPSVLDYQAILSQEMHVSPNFKLDDNQSTANAKGSGPYWSEGRLSSAIYETAIDILPWQNNTTLSYRVHFSDEISGLDTDDFQLVDINGQASAAILEVRPATLTGAATRSQKTSSDRYIVTIGEFSGQTAFKLVLKDDATFYSSVGGREIEGVVENYSNMDFYELPGSIIRFNDALDTPKLGELITSDSFYPNGVPTEVNMSLNTILPTFIPSRDHFEIIILLKDGTSFSKLEQDIQLSITPTYDVWLEEFPHFYNLKIDLSSLAQANIDFANLTVFVNTENTQPLMTKWGISHLNAIGSTVNITAPTVDNIRLHSVDNSQVTFALDTSESVYIKNTEDFLQCCQLQTAAGTILPLALTGLNEGTTFLLQADVSDLSHNERLTFSLEQWNFPLEGTDGSGVGNTRLSLRNSFDDLDIILDKQAAELTASSVYFTNSGPTLTLQFDELVSTNLSTLPSLISTANDQVLDVIDVVENTDQGYSIFDITFTIPHQQTAAQIQVDLSNAVIQDDFNNRSLFQAPQDYELCFPNLILHDMESNIFGDDTAIQLLEGAEAKSMSLSLACPPSDTITVQVVRDGDDAISINGRTDRTTELTFTPSNWNEPQLLALELLDNDYFEADRTIALSFEFIDTASDEMGYQLAPGKVINLTLQDDDYYLRTDDPYLGFVLEEGITSPQINVSGNAVSEIPTTLILEVIGAQFLQPVESLLISKSESADLNAQLVDNSGVKYVFSAEPNGPTENNTSIQRVEFIAQSEVVAWFDIKVEHSEVLTSVTEQVLVEGGDAATLTVQLDSPPIEPTRFAVTSIDETELTVSPDVLEFNEFNWNQPQQVVITPVQDIEQDGDTNASISLSVSDTIEYNPENVYAQYPAKTFEFNVRQSALSSFTVSELNGQIAEGGQAQFTVVLNEPPTLPTNSQTIFITTNNNEANISTGELLFTSDNWNVPQTVIVQGTDDNNVDGTSNVTIAIRSVTGSTSLQGTNTSIKTTVSDNDTWPKPDFTITVPEFYEGLDQFPSWMHEDIALNTTFTAKPNQPTKATFEVVYDVNNERVGRKQCPRYSDECSLIKKELFTLSGGEWNSYDSIYVEGLSSINDDIYNGTNTITGVIRYIEGDPVWEGFEKEFTYQLVDDEIGFQLTDLPLQITSGESWDFNVYLSAFRVGEMAGFFEDRRPTERYADIQLSTDDPQVSVLPTSMKIESHTWDKNRPYHNETDIRLTYIQDGDDLQAGIFINQQALIFNTDNWNVPQIIEIETYGEVDSGQSTIYGVSLNIDETIENRDSRFDASDVIFEVALVNELPEASDDSTQSRTNKPGLILSENIIYTYPSETASIAVSLSQAPQGEVRVRVNDLGKQVKLQLRSTGRDGLKVKPKDVIMYAQKTLGLVETALSVTENETQIGLLNPSYSATVTLGDSKYSDLFSITDNILSLSAPLDYEVTSEPISLPLFITDSFGNQVTQTITVTVIDANDAPVINILNSLTAEEGKPVSTRFTYTDQDGDTVSATVSTTPSNGSVSVDGTNVTYTPAANFHGSDSFVLTLTDGNGYETTQIINVTVNQVNDAPEAFDLHRATEIDTATTFALIARDADGDALTYEIVTGPANGTASIEMGTNQLTYQPDANFTGADTLTYRVSDSTGTDNANSEIKTVTIHVFSGYLGIARQVGLDIAVEGEYSEAYHESRHSVSVSDDGLTVAIGETAPVGQIDVQGGVRIYRYNADLDIPAWEQLGGEIDVEVGIRSGWSVSLSGNGRTLAIGAPLKDRNSNTRDSGYVRIYTHNSDTLAWEQLGADIDGEGEDDYSGWSVDLSADGRTVAIGAPRNDNNSSNSGHVRIYHYNTELTTPAWEQLGSDIDGEGEGDRSGWSISLSSDGRTVAVGAPYSDINTNDSGDVRIYRYNTNLVTPAWEPLGSDLDIIGLAPGDRAGWSVSLSGDGRTVAVGSPNANGIGSASDAGHVRIFRYNPEIDTPRWEPLGQEIEGDEAFNASGYSVSLSADGRTVAIGAPYNDSNDLESGRVRLYRYDVDDDAWEQLGTDINGQKIYEHFGSSVSLSADSRTVAIGAMRDFGQNRGFGRVRVYRLDNTAPVATAQSLSVNEGDSIDITLTGMDADGDELTFTVDASGLGNDASLVAKDDQNNTYTLTPSDYVNGDLTFTFTASDDLAISKPATVSITVNPVDNAVTDGVNYGFTSTASASVGNEDHAQTMTMPSVDKDGQTLVYSVATQPSNGVVTVAGNVFTYTPAANVNGTDGFNYTVTDNADDATRAVTQTAYVKVTAVNDAPEAFDLQRATETNTATTFALIGRDADIHALTYEIVTGPTNGSASIEAGTNQLTYQPDANFTGADTLTYRVSDGTGADNEQSEIKTVTIQVFSGYLDIARQMGNDIDGEAAYDESGRSVSLSADGRTVAIGTPYNDGNGSNSGHVRIYTYNSDTSAWKQLGGDIDGETEYASSGYSVSLSADGRTVAIGAPINNGNGTDSGHVRIYTYSSDTTSWTQLGTDIDGEAEYDQSGYSISLSADGRTVAIGAPYNNGSGGHVRIYTYNSDTFAWVQLGSDIDGEAIGDASGSSVSLSADGRTVAIRAPYNDGNGLRLGHVRIYIYNMYSFSWMQIGSDIDGDVESDISGWSVSLSADGRTVAIGARTDNGIGSASGSVRIYTYNSDTFAWVQLGGDINGEADLDLSGYSVSLSADGRKVAIGAPLNDNNSSNSGHVRIYTYNSDTSAWTQLGADIDGEAEFDLSGSSVSLSADGRTVAIGAIYNDGNGLEAGHVRIYRLDNTAPVATAQSLSVNEGDSIDITLTGTDADGDELTFTADASGLGNDASLVAKDDETNTYTLTPSDYFNGELTFTFTASDDSSTSEPATVSITVNPVDNAVTDGVNYGFASTASASVGNEDHAQTLTMPSVDKDGQTLVYSVATQPSNGVVTVAGNVFTYTPAANVNGTDGFNYTVTDNADDATRAVTQTAYVNVVSVNDAPVITIGDALTLDEDGNASLTFTYTDVDGDTVSAEVSTSPENGLATLDGTQVTYTPDANYNGSDSFVLTLTDGNGYETTQIINVTVNQVNDAPEAFDLHRATEIDTATTFALIGRDVDGDVLTYEIVSTPNNGSLVVEQGSNKVTFTPDNGFRGIDTFSYRVIDSSDSDNNQSDISTVTINVSPKTWLSQLGEDILGVPTRSKYGRSVSLSADGRTMAIGDFNERQDGVFTRATAGRVRVYTYHNDDENSGWQQLGIFYGEELGDKAGHSVSLSADGRTVAIGAYMNDGNGLYSGHVRVYTYETDGETAGWKRLGGDIDGESTQDNSGWSVSLSADGRTVAIGAPYNSDNGRSAGHVRVYSYHEKEWQQLGPDIDGEEEGDRSGYSVSLGADGRTLAIGAPYHDDNGLNSGQTRIYRYDHKKFVWEQLGTDINGEAEGDQSGHSVSLSADGLTVAIGAPYNGQTLETPFNFGRSSSGHVRVYRYHNETLAWQQLGIDIHGDRYATEQGDMREGQQLGDASFGHSVSISADGQKVAVGATEYYYQHENEIETVGHGQVRVYEYNTERETPEWHQVSSREAHVGLNTSINLSGDGSTVAVGAPYDYGLRPCLQTASIMNWEDCPPASNDPWYLQSSVGAYRLKDTAPVAIAQSLTTNEGAAIDITLTGTDGDGDSLRFTVDDSTLEQNAILTAKEGEENTYILTPTAYFNGELIFTFTARDTRSNSMPASVIVTVNALDNAVDDGVVYGFNSADSASVGDEDTSQVLTMPSVDRDGQTLVYDIVTQPTSGVISVNGHVFTYTPNTNAFGEDSFTYAVTDNPADETRSVTQTAYIVVTSVNDAPYSIPIPEQAFTPGDYLEFNVADFFGDEDANDELAFTFANQPMLNLEIIDGVISGYVDTEESFSVTVTATDSQGLSVSAEIRFVSRFAQ